MDLIKWDGGEVFWVLLWRGEGTNAAFGTRIHSWALPPVFRFLLLIPHHPYLSRTTALTQLDASLLQRDPRWHCERSYTLQLAGGRVGATPDCCLC